MSGSIWLPKGEPGDKGPDGDPGPQGPQGPEGPPGPGAEEFAEFKAALESNLGAEIIGTSTGNSVQIELDGIKDTIENLPTSNEILIYSSQPSDPPLYTPFMVVIPPDITKPVVTSFTMAASGISPLPVTSFTGSDNVGVTGYWLGESSAVPALNAAGWSTTPPTQYITSSTGNITVYARVRDAAGNISDPVSQAVTVTVSPYIDIGWPYNASVHTSVFSVAAGSFTNVTSIPVTLAETAQIKNVQVPMRKQIESAYPGVGGVTLTIRTGSSTGTAISTATIPNITSGTFETKTFTLPSNLTLTAGTQYFFVFSITPGSNSGGDVVHRLSSNPSGPGTILNSYNNGAFTSTAGQSPLRLEKV